MTSRISASARTALASVPGLLEAAWSIRDLFFPLRKHSIPGRTFHRWLEELSKATALKADDPPVRVLFFACRNAWMRISLATAVVLLSRNVKIDFVYLPYEAYDGEDPVADRRRFQYSYGRYVQNGIHPRLRFTNLREVPPTTLTAELRREAEAQSVFDTQFILLREEVDPDRDPDDRRVFEFRLGRNLDCMARMLTVIRTGEYDFFVTPNGGIREMGGAWRVARSMGLPTRAFEFFDRSDSVVVAQDRPVNESATAECWTASADTRLSDDARARVQDFMTTRLGTQWRGFSWTCQRAPYRGNRKAVLSALHLSESTPRVVLLCANIPWDSVVMGHDGAFASHQDWVRKAVSRFTEQSDAHLIVRSHPDEALWGTTEPLDVLVRSLVGDQCPGITVLAPDSPINTYDLMDVCDIGLVYSSTAGLEMALRGIPVVVAGRPHYSGKGFTSDPASPDAYFAAVDDFLRQARGVRMPPRQVELAWCYADVYLFSWQMPFPWARSSFWEDIERWPMSRVLSEEGQRQFGSTFDLFLGPGTSGSSTPDTASPGQSARRAW